MLSAAASLGWLYLWDVEDSINLIDPFICADDINIQVSYFNEEFSQKAGALLATGMINSTVHNENDPALAILSEFIESDKPLLRATSIMGLGIAYTASSREDLKELFLPIISDTSLDLQLSGIAALALGQIFIGQGAKADNEIASTMLQTLMEMEPEQLKSPWIKFYCLGLALLFFGRQDASDAIVETLKAIDHPIANEAIVMLSLCSFAGTGEVLRIQQMLRLCAERPEITEKDDEKEKDEKKEEEMKEDKKKGSEKGEFSEGLAVIAIAVIAMGEDVGKELCMRHFGHLVLLFCHLSANDRCISASQ
jgi:26S proteasome regulatory subunit N1